jgi:hypothetical protein
MFLRHSGVQLMAKKIKGFKAAHKAVQESFAKKKAAKKKAKS